MEMMLANPSKPTINANTPTWLPLPVAVANLAAASRVGMDNVTWTLVPCRSYNEESAHVIEGNGELARRKKGQTVPPARHGNYKHGVHHCTRSKAM